ncbi:hypothetical protein ACFSKW_46340 [Nonomuraea mangrovi]|uniref:DUF5709 domain-containing protein n=1 Tax=Nonomuraea mangrovi TaxID=2316207 RepID=A0ABW4TC78_9ACTN
MSETPDARYTGEEAAERVDRALNDDGAPDEVDQRDAHVVAEAEAAPLRQGRPEQDDDGDPEEAARREALWKGSPSEPGGGEVPEPPD